MNPLSSRFLPSRLRRSKAVRPAARFVLEVLEDRILLYATNGGKWTYPEHITMSFVPDGTQVVVGTGSNLFKTLSAIAPTATWEAAFEKDAAMWATYANINLSVVSDNGTAMGTTGDQQGDPVFGDIRIGMMPLTGGVLAYTFLPPPLNGDAAAGDIIFNSNINWTVGSNSGYDIETVALHEIGHALGMDHSTNPADVMYAYYNGENENLTQDDINGIDSIYGAQPAGGANQSFATATNLNPIMNTSTLQIADSGLALTPTSISQYFETTVPSGGNGSMTVTMQTTNLSLLNPEILVYNSAHTLITGASLPNSYGGTTSVTINGVTAGQTYYIVARPASAPGADGAYGLLVNFGWDSQSPIPAPYSTVAATGDEGGDTEQEGIGPTPGSSNPSPIVPVNPTGVTAVWGDHKPALLDPNAVDPGLAAGGGETLVWSGDQMQFTFSSGLTDLGEAMRATVPSSPAAAPVGPLSSLSYLPAGSTNNVVVTLPKAATTAVVTPKTPPPIVPLAPWTPVNTQAQDAAIGLWNAPDSGLSLSSIFDRDHNDS